MLWKNEEKWIAIIIQGEFTILPIMEDMTKSQKQTIFMKSVLNNGFLLMSRKLKINEQ